MKKTALQQLIQWGEQMMSEHPLKVLSFAEAIDKAAELLEVEKEQIMKALDRGFDEGSSFPEDISLNNAQQYYNETYGGDK
jgi:hypothetical protein